MFESLGEKFEGIFRRLRGQKTLTEDNIQEALREVRMALLEADVNYLVVKDFVARVREQALGQDVIKGVNPAEQLYFLVHKELVRVMTGDPEADKAFETPAGKRTQILLLGLQGSGKTTFSGKLALKLKDDGRRPLLVACDIYRPAAVEQLKQVGATVGIPVFEQGTDRPVLEIIRNAQAHAQQTNRDVLIIDTAGRLTIDEVKMDELRAVREQVKPDYTFLVADAMTGQDAVNSAQTFNGEIGIDGVCLTKLDGDARGGAALSIKAVTGKPIVFVGVGEKPADLERFHPDRAAQRILGMGDVASLVEKAQQAMTDQDAQDLTEKMVQGSFTYDDFLKQMKMIEKMGSLKGLLGMLPGIGSALKEVDNEQLTGALKGTEALILSMTKEERANPDLVSKDGNRRQRIALGAGHRGPKAIKAVNDLVKQFEQMRAMMRQMGSMGGMGGLMGKAKGLFGGGGGGGMAAPALPAPGKEPTEADIRAFRKQQKQMKASMERQARPSSFELKKARGRRKGKKR